MTSINDRPLGVDAPRMEVFIIVNGTRHTWKIKKATAAEPIQSKLLETVDHYKKEYARLVNESMPKARKFSLEIDKKIADMALVDFKFDKLIRDENVGVHAVELLIQELVGFLLGIGSAIGNQYLQVLSDTGLQTPSNSSPISKKN